MLRKAARLALLCVVLIAATTDIAAGRDTAAPGWSRPGVGQEVTRVPELIREWVARLIGVQPKCSAGIDPDGKPCPTSEVQLKCSMGIDPNGSPCAVPSAGCRCVP